MQNTTTLRLPAIKTLKINLSLKIFWLLALAMLFSLFITCLFQLNSYTSEFYLIKKQENRIHQLSQENKLLEINFSKASSLNNIGGFVENSGFERIKQVQYIKVLEGTALVK